MALTAHKMLATATPTYLSDLVHTRALARALRSSDAPQMVVPQTNTDLAQRAFSVAAPSSWNTLPSELRLCHSTATHLNTHLFTLNYSHLSPPPALLHLRTPWRCTNAVIIIIIIICIVLYWSV